MNLRPSQEDDPLGLYHPTCLNPQQGGKGRGSQVANGEPGEEMTNISQTSDSEKTRWVLRGESIFRSFCKFKQ